MPHVGIDEAPSASIQAEFSRSAEQRALNVAPNAGEVEASRDHLGHSREPYPATGRRRVGHRLGMLAELERPDGSTLWIPCRPHVECDGCRAAVDHEACPVRAVETLPAPAEGP